VTVFISLLALTSCSTIQHTKDDIKLKIYESDALYYENTYFYTTASDLGEIYMPLIANKNIVKVDDVYFYNNDEEVKFTSCENRVDFSRIGNEYRGYIYVSLDFNIFTNYKIDRISILAEESKYNFNVDINITKCDFNQNLNGISCLHSSYKKVNNNYISYYALDTSSSTFRIDNITNVNDNYNILKCEISKISNLYNNLTDDFDYDSLQYSEISYPLSCVNDSEERIIFRITYDKIPEAMMFEDSILLSGIYSLEECHIVSKGSSYAWDILKNTDNFF